MKIEAGDFFIVERGPMVSPKVLAQTGGGDGPKVEQITLDQIEVEVFKGQLFKALEVDGERWVAAEVVFAPSEACDRVAGDLIGRKYIVDANKLVLTTVAKGFAEALIRPAPGGLDVQA